MARHTTLQLLQPVTKTGTLIRHNPGPLPPNSLVVRTPKARGPELAPEIIGDAPEATYGQQIYVYSNKRTKQVVYSLTRHLNNAVSMSQIPFIGKKSVPATLRKDLWSPFFLATFPHSESGLLAYRRLREFRRLHEVSYPPSLVADPKNPSFNLPKKKKARVLMDQKANSVADLAAVLLLQEKGPKAKRVEKYERAKERFDRLTKQGAKKVQKKDGPLNIGTLHKGVEGVKVFWRDLKDAEFARTWPKQVVHGDLARSGFTAAWPLPTMMEEEEMVEEIEQVASKADGGEGKIDGAIGEEAQTEGGKEKAGVAEVVASNLKAAVKKVSAPTST